MKSVICLQNSRVLGTGEKNHMCPVLKVHDVNDIRQTEIYAAKYLSPVAWRLRWVMKSLKDINQIPADMIRAAGRTVSMLQGVIQCNYLQEG